MVGEDLIRKALSEKKPMTEGIRILETGPDFPRKKASRKALDLSTPVENWTTPTFVKFCYHLYHTRYSKSWNLNFAAQCNEVLKLRDAIVDTIGYCDNHILKQFLEWFFYHRADGFMTKASGLYISQMRENWVLENFANNFDLHRKSGSSVVENKKKEPVQTDEMEDVFLLSSEEFVERYGLVLTVNWLISKKGLTLKDSLKYVYSATEQLKKRGKIHLVVEATERLSPYSSESVFKQPDLILKKIGYEQPLNIKFQEKGKG
jgi:hypothetical protein